MKERTLIHYGIKRRSGRYPWGSGDNPYQRTGDFLSRVEKLEKEGMSQTEIAKAMGMSTTDFRAQKAIAKDERRALQVATAKSLRKRGYSLNEIAKEMGFDNDSSVRNLLNENSEVRMNKARATADILKKMVDEKGMIDVGVGQERELGNISREKLNQALKILEDEGYYTFGGGVPQVTNPGKQINLKVLCPPGTPYKINEDGKRVSSAIYDFDKINSITDYVSHDGGDTFDPKFVYPKSMDSSRLKINYAEEGGLQKDGVIELRRGVDDISLGNSHYAQVRILVDGTHYIKGMAVYSDNMPDGVDVVFNTNKKLGTPMKDVLKPITNDPDNPFGSLIKEGINDPDKPNVKDGGQSYYIDKNGKKQLSLINKRAEEGDWGEWADHLPSQFLSKQSIGLINKQLSLAKSEKQAEFDEICSLTNPTVKKKLLQSFADDCDSAAVHLQAAALPGQKYQVILPVPSMKDTEVYAPNYDNGEKVALIRYPHGGTFEIPILKVNNNHPEGEKLFGNALDAVGINSKVAERLSGADFDGDTVMVIPIRGKTKITSTKPLDGLIGFDPKMEYGTIKVGDNYVNSSGNKIHVMKKEQTQTEMGKISNLITDMTLLGANEDELARAVRHSMVVIDAEKHHLDYRQSERDNDISSLKKEYQGRIDENGRYHEGAATIISRAKSQVSVTKRRGSPKPDPVTGELIFKEVEQKTYIDKKTGKVKERTQKSTQMAETKDPHTLSSGTHKEEAYADYASSLKSLANRARLEMLSTGKIAYVASAKEKYKDAVDSLNAKLDISLRNAPKERKAQLMANTIISAKKAEYPDMTKKEIKKVSQQALTQSRVKVGAKRVPVDITPYEWEAIQSGAISENTLYKILNHADIDKVREYATPRAKVQLSDAKKNHIRALNASGYTTAQIADKLNVSTSTVRKYLKD